jgi:hypothetical protein
MEESLEIMPEELRKLKLDDWIRMMSIDSFNNKDEKDAQKKSKNKELTLEEMIIPEAEELRLKIPGDLHQFNSDSEQKEFLKLTDEEMLLTNNGYIIDYEPFKELLRLKLAKKIRTRVNINAKVIASPERRYSVWTGGSVVGSMSQFDELMIKKEEYQEVGPWIVQIKCYS